MKIIIDETSIVKRQQIKFLTFEEKTTIVQLLSNVCVLKTHWLPNKKTKVLCVGEKCVVCSYKVPIKKEYVYYAKINGQEGMLRVSSGVFFDMNAIEDATKTKKQDFLWMIIKQGTGKETRYSVLKHADVSQKANLEEGNQKLLGEMQEYEQALLLAYRRIVEEVSSHD